MSEIKKHSTKNWEISMREYENHIGKKYKVTGRLLGLSVTETKISTLKIKLGNNLKAG